MKLQVNDLKETISNQKFNIPDSTYEHDHT